MERFIDGIADWAHVLVPLLAVWAIVGLYTQRTGNQCIATQLLFLFVMVFISGVTVRTVIVDGGCWLTHTASLGIMVVSGVMRRPEVDSEEYMGDLSI